jgi:hypothetical protein
MENQTRIPRQCKKLAGKIKAMRPLLITLTANHTSAPSIQHGDNSHHHTAIRTVTNIYSLATNMNWQPRIHFQPSPFGSITFF